MFQKTFLAVALCLSTLALRADLTLQSMEYAEAQILIQVNEAVLKNTLLENLGEQKQSECNGGKPAFSKQLEALLPPGVQGTARVAIALGDCNDTTVPDVETIDADLTKVKFLGAATFGASVQPIFSKAQLLPMMDPTIGEKVSIQPIQVDGYAGYRVSDKNNNLKTLDVILSNDGCTALFGHKDMVAVAAAGKNAALSPALAAAKAANANDAIAVAFADPKHQHQDDIKAALEDSPLDPVSRATLENIQSFAILFNSTPDTIKLTIRGFFPDEAGATAVRDNVLDTILIQGAKQFIPFFLPETTFADTLAATQKGNVAEIAASFTEADINSIITTIQNAAAIEDIEIDEEAEIDIDDLPVDDDTDAIEDVDLDLEGLE